MRVTTVAWILALVLAGCGSPRGSAGQGDDPVATSAPPGVSSPQPAGPSRVEPRPGMDDVRPIPWRRARPVGGSRVDVFFTSGVKPCYVLDRAEVVLDANRVIITLFEGSDPRSDAVACNDLAVSKVVRVELPAPLDGRRLVDGARN